MDFDETSALGFRKKEKYEKGGRQTANAKYPEGVMVSDEVFEVVEESGNQEPEEPAEAGAEGGRERLDVRREYLAHDGPRKRTESGRVDHHVDDNCQYRHEGEGGSVRARAVEVEADAEDALEREGRETVSSGESAGGGPTYMCDGHSNGRQEKQESATEALHGIRSGTRREEHYRAGDDGRDFRLDRAPCPPEDGLRVEEDDVYPWERGTRLQD